MTHAIRTPRNRLSVALLCAGLLLSSLSLPAAADQASNHSLYYRMGGAEPAGHANYKNQIALRLGIDAKLRMSYSCGKFDIGLSWSNVMNGFSQLGTQISNAVKAGIASLPMYALQRAQPGLYQMLQEYSAKADAIVNASLKTCEEMEATIKKGGNPYADYIEEAKNAAWKLKSSEKGDVVQAKLDINKNEEAQNTGMPWVFGGPAGGKNTLAIQPVRDIAVAGYNATLNKPTSTPSTTLYSAAPEKSSRLVAAFASPDELAKFTTDVLGDKKVFLCTTASDCPVATSVNTATGLNPKYEQEIQLLQPKLDAMVNAEKPNYADLQAIAAPGMALSPALLDSVRAMPSELRALTTGRLTQELAMQRVINKALVARNTLLTGLSLPEVSAAGQATKDVTEKVDRMTAYINDMMFEFRVRKEMTSDTALAILGDQGRRDARSGSVPGGKAAERDPLVDGRVKQ